MDLIKSFSLFAALAFACCSSSEARREFTSIRDTSVTTANAFSDLQMDSVSLAGYIRENNLGESTARQLVNFYLERNYHYAWFTTDGLAEHGKAFWNHYRNHKAAIGDTSTRNSSLYRFMHTVVNDDAEAGMQPAEIMQKELELTLHFMSFARQAYEGKVDPSEVQWNIPRKRINAIALLDSLVSGNTDLQQLEPVNEDYQRLRKSLRKYREIEKTGGWAPIVIEQKVVRKGDTAAGIAQLKRRLHQVGDYMLNDTSHVYTDELEWAVLQAQERFGLQADGVVGPATLRALNVPLEDRVKQMLANLERMKWIPEQDSGRRLVANIPAYQLHVYDENEEQFSMRIVVGNAATRSVIFSDKLEYVVFSPYWNIRAALCATKSFLPCSATHATCSRQTWSKQEPPMGYL